jgi:glycosyltransferase involved in cell wall biosynthesis
MISVIIPAHNESAVIQRTLAAAQAALRHEPGELIVVCNGCTDDTAAICRQFSDEIKVIELRQGSKILALNAGDRVATGFPRFYVDADIVVSETAFRDVANVLREGPVHAAAPRMVIDCESSSWCVRAFYRVWTETPYHQRGHVGSGLFAVSEAGRGQFGEFPNIIADDEYLRRLFEPSKRRIVENCTFSIDAPRNLKSLIKVKTRSRLGNYQLVSRYPELRANNGRSGMELLRKVVRRPSLWGKFPVYSGVVLLTTWRASRQFAEGKFGVWERDETSRSSSVVSSPGERRLSDAVENGPITSRV